MKRFILILALFFVFADVLSAVQPEVAVLDALIPDTMDKAVIIPITDKIVEALVVSGKYTVLDRGNIEQVLKEKEFQVSGLVKDTEIKKAGEYLGADFVVVARVSRIESTYFISAKMIDVKTGAIKAQTSDQQEGTSVILISIAERVGKKLAGGIIEDVTEQPVVEKREAVKTAPPPLTVKPQKKAAGTFSKLVVSYLNPLFLSDVYDGFEDRMDDFALLTYSTFGYGIDLYWSQFVLPYVYLSGSFAYTSLDYSEVILDYSVFSFTDLQAGAGMGYAFGDKFQVFMGALGGVAILRLGDFWVEDGDEELAFCYGFELGADFLVLKNVTLSMRIHYTHVSFTSDTGDIFDTTWDTGTVIYSEPYLLESVAILIGIGYAY